MKLMDSKNIETDNQLSLRPQKLSQYIGQSEIKENLKIFIGAALSRDEPLDHILLYGPAGLGKTTLAYVIANEMHSKIHFSNGPSFEKVGDLISLLNEIEPGDVLFIDEIHRLPKNLCETLYSAMEDFIIHVIISNDNNTKSLEMTLPPFTLIGSTTRAGDLPSPLRARFGYVEKLHFYTVEEIKDIVIRSAVVFGCSIDLDAAYEIAKRSRGTPRIANNLLKRVRDFSNYDGRTIINHNDALNALRALKVDNIGLDEVDINYLKVLVNRYNGGPVGLQTLANAIGEEVTNLEDVYEPYLIQISFIEITIKGRIATDLAKKHIKNYTY